MKPLVSILIPAYNADAWISFSLRSAIAQTWEPKEIIVVDDGSTDGTLALARQFESPQLRVVTQKNQGAAAARNSALAMSRGEYIQYLDADDLLAPDKIERQMEALLRVSSPRTLASCSWGKFFYRHERAKFVPSALWCNLTPIEWLLRKMQKNAFMQTSTWLVSRKLAEAAGPWDTGLLGDDDGEYFCRVLLACDEVLFVPEARVYYRYLVPNSLSSIGKSNKKLDAQWRSIENHIRYIRSLEDSQRVREACIAYLRSWAPMFDQSRPDLKLRADQLAESLGGKIALPAPPWKFAWLEVLFGRRLAREVRHALQRMKWTAVRRWDKMLFKIEGALSQKSAS